jgi:hypothetical protein
MKRAIGVLFAAALLTSTASADVISFAGGLGGSLSWNGGNTSLNGNNIGLESVTDAGAAKHGDISIALTGNGGCLLSFSCAGLQFATGAFMGVSSGGILNFAPGGSFEITGGISPTIPSNTVLLSGQFTGITTFDPILGVFATTTGSGAGSLSGSLLSYFGFQGQDSFNFTSQIVSLQLPPSLRYGFTGLVLNSHLTLTDPPGDGDGGGMNSSPVPEPASIVLLSLVLLGCTTILRRHRVNRGL